MAIVDPRTKQATAWYALIGVAAWDAIQRGVNRWNLAALLLLALPGLVAAVAKMIGRGSPPGDPPNSGGDPS